MPENCPKAAAAGEVLRAACIFLRPCTPPLEMWSPHVSCSPPWTLVVGSVNNASGS